MIQITIIKNDNLIRSIESEGHDLIKTGFFEKLIRGKRFFSAICAAVSTLNFTYLNSLEQLKLSNFTKKIKPGYFRIDLSEYNEKNEDHLKCLNNFYIIGILALKKKYTGSVTVTIREDNHGT